MKKLIAIIILFISVFAQAQNSGLYWDNLDEKSNRLQGKITGETFYISPEANSYYFLQDDWVDGKVILVDGDTYEKLFMRYNAFEDELILYNKNRNSLFTADKENIHSFIIKENGKETEFEKLPYKSYNSSFRFFRIIYSGKQKLVAHHYVTEVKVSPYKDRNSILRDTEFRPQTDYYLFDGKTEFNELQLKRKSFLHLLPEHKKEIKRLFRKNRLIFNNEIALTQAVILLEQEGFLY